MNPKTKKPLRGFAAMSDERRRQVASMGGKRSQELGVNHRFNSETGKKAGRKGGAVVFKKYGIKHFSRIGKKGGKAKAVDM